MNRQSNLTRLQDKEYSCDVLVIGGGASGLGTAVEAASRGYRTLLLEQDDFSKGTSSRSTKLVHGGVRYLAQGNIRLVMEALRERGRLRRNAPHLVRDQPFIIPCYTWWWMPFYTIGLTLYDLLAGRLGIGRSVPVSAQTVRKCLPAIKGEGLWGGVRYYDCQFDDARLAINLCQTLHDLGGTGVNYMRVTGLQKERGRLCGVFASDMLNGREYRITASVVINATGVFVDRIIKMDEPGRRDVVKPSQGIHLVLERSSLWGGEALMVPRTSDGRVLFAIPWHHGLVVGTTDVEREETDEEPVASEEEVTYLLDTASRFFADPPGRKDVRSVFSGLRPLAAPAGKGKKTKEISRGHRILVSDSGLITLVGGKWTTYRKMGEDVVDRASAAAGLPPRRSVSSRLRIHGYRFPVDRSVARHWYGSDLEQLQDLIRGRSGLESFVSEKLQIIRAQIVWSVRNEMAQTVEDFLARRTRALQLDASESIRMAPAVASVMAEELGHDGAWEDDQVAGFTGLARRCLLSDSPGMNEHIPKL